MAAYTTCMEWVESWSAEEASQNCFVKIMSPYLVPIATIFTGICLWTTNISDIIMYHCHNVSVSVTNLCLILTTYSAQSVNGG